MGGRAPQWLVWGGIGLLVVGVTAGLTIELLNPRGVLRTFWARYQAQLDREARFLFLGTSGRRIAGFQLAAGMLVLLALVLLEDPLILSALFLVAVAPLWQLKQARQQRILKIEQQLDSWMLLLANALKASPSLGEAIAASAKIVRPPIRQELDLLLKQMQLGTPLDQAVIDFSERIRSRTVSSALATILVGRQTGGNLPRILEESAATLREMARLEGVVRTKTAEGKSQAWVLGAVPFFLVAVIHYMEPTWLLPLTDTAMGTVIIVLASLMWVGAILLARKILAVDI